MNLVKYRWQQAIKQRLWREGLTHVELLAKFLWVLYFEMNMEFGPRDYEGSQYEIEGVTYTEFINWFVKSCWLYRIPKHRITRRRDYFRFEPGLKFMTYIRREKAHRVEMASMEDVYKTGERLRDEIKADRAALEGQIAKLGGRVENLEDILQLVCHKLKVPYEPPGHRPLLKVLKGGAD